MNERFGLCCRFCFRLLSWMILMLVARSAQSETSLGAYWGQGVDHNLREMPAKVLGGELEYEAAYLAAVDYQTTCWEPEWLRSFGIAGRCQGVLAKHWGIQSHLETDLGYQVSSPAWFVANVKLNLLASMGVSYAWGDPHYEDGPIDAPEKRYRLQNFNAYDLSIRPVGLNYSIFVRIHHRSGIYGLIAPSNVGSNFVSLGVAWHFFD